jgi:hypothetical protein
LALNVAHGRFSAAQAIARSSMSTPWSDALPARSFSHSMMRPQPQPKSSIDVYEPIDLPTSASMTLMSSTDCWPDR